MSPKVEKRRWALAVLLVPLATLFVFLVLVGLSARGLSRDHGQPGSIVLSDVTLIQDRGELYLDVKADIDLPVTIRAGLDNGVPLIFELALRFFEPSTYWFDTELATIERRFSLTYYELTRHYRVKSINTNTSRNFRSLSAALRGLGSIERLPLNIDQHQMTLSNDAIVFAEGDGELFAALDFRLDSRSLPLPLQPVITSSWRLASKEVLWSVN